MADQSSPAIPNDKIRTFRWFFYLSSIQLLAFFVVPALLFPRKYILHIELISALTVGLVVALFYLLVNVCGLCVDKHRRLLYLALIVFVILWFLWAVVTWSHIEHMDYILR
jgi:hypothetical protein